MRIFTNPTDGLVCLLSSAFVEWMCDYSIFDILSRPSI